MYCEQFANACGTKHDVRTHGIYTAPFIEGVFMDRPLATTSVMLAYTRYSFRRERACLRVFIIER